MQSAKSIHKNYPKVTVNLIDNISFSNKMNENTVYFVNWEKLRNEDSVYLRDGEKDNFKDLIKRTKENGTRIVLIVDESHIGKKEKTQISAAK